MTNTAIPLALVTGAARRLGRGIALELACQGWDIALHYHSSETEARQTRDQIRTLGRRAEVFCADLEDSAQCLQLLEDCEQRMGPVTCLVNSASRFEYDAPHGVEARGLNAHMAINLTAPLLLSRQLFATRQRQLPQGPTEPAERAVIINLLDQKLFNPNPDFFSYTLSKAALETATRLLAQAYAPWVRVVGLAPGITLPSGGQSEAQFLWAHRQTPLGYSSSLQDITQAVVYLVQAQAITGTTLVVDGGQHLTPSTRDVMFKHA